MADEAEVEVRLSTAVAAAMPDTLITRWVAVVEVIEDDGSRSLYTAHSEDLTTWDSLGMLDHALTGERKNVE